MHTSAFSTEEQNEACQIEALKKHGIEKWFTEKISGKSMDRPQLQAMLDYVREGDTVYIHDFSRLARSTRDLLEIVNVEGAGGANGIDFTCKQPADGYTYVLGTQSHIMLDLQKILPVDFKKELRPVAKLVHSINIIASSKKAQEGKYSNFTEFVDYAKAHPQELTCGMLTATGADSVALKQTLAGGLGCDITEVEQYVKVVNYSSGSELSSAMVGGHININITGADEIMGLIQSGDIVPLISISENRMSTLPDLECTGELGIDSYVGTWRGILCRTDTPDAAVNAMADALKEAWNTPDYQEFLKNACYLDRPGYADAEEFQQLIDEEYTTFEDYLKGAGLI